MDRTSDIPSKACFAFRQDGPGKACLPVEDRQAGLPVKDGQTGLPVEDGQASLPVKDGQAGLPVKDRQAGLPVKDGQASLPVKDGQASLPVKARQTSIPVKDRQAGIVAIVLGLILGAGGLYAQTGAISSARLVGGSQAVWFIMPEPGSGYYLAVKTAGKGTSWRRVGGEKYGTISAATVSGKTLTVLFPNGQYVYYLPDQPRGIPGVKPPPQIWPSGTLALSACPAGTSGDKVFVLVSRPVLPRPPACYRQVGRDRQVENARQTTRTVTKPTSAPASQPVRDGPTTSTPATRSFKSVYRLLKFRRSGRAVHARQLVLLQCSEGNWSELAVLPERFSQLGAISPSPSEAYIAAGDEGIFVLLWKHGSSVLMKFTLQTSRRDSGKWRIIDMPREISAAKPLTMTIIDKTLVLVMFGPANPPTYLPGGGRQAYLPGGGRQAYLPGGGRQAYPPGGGRQAYLPGGGRQAYPPGGGRQAYPPGRGRQAYLPGGGRQAYLPGGGRQAYPPGRGRQESNATDNGRVLIARLLDNKWDEVRTVRKDERASTWNEKNPPTVARFDSQLAIAWMQDDKWSFATCSLDGQIHQPKPLDVFERDKMEKFLETAQNVFLWVVLGVMVVLMFWPGQPIRSGPFSLPTTMFPAKLSKRLIAACIDTVPFLLPTIVLAVQASSKFPPASVVTIEDAQRIVSTPRFLLAFLGFMTAYPIYCLAMEYRYGASIGKMVMKLRVVGDGGKNASLREVALRNVSKIVELMSLWMVFPILFPLLTRYRQRLGDKISWTAVVDAALSIPPPLYPSQGDTQETARRDGNNTDQTGGENLIHVVQRTNAPSAGSSGDSPWVG